MSKFDDPKIQIDPNKPNDSNSNDDNEDNDSYNSDQDYYEYERKKIQAALDNLKAKKNNQILDQLRKNIQQEIEELEEYEDQILELHNITRNNQKNVLEDSVIKEIKEKVFNQSMMHTIQLTDQQLEKKKEKQEIIDKQKAVANKLVRDKSVDEAESKLNRKMEIARMEREIMQMNREDQLSMRYQQQFLSQFFTQRFYTPDLKICENKPIQIKMPNYTPKPTFTNLKPLANTQNNVLPRNAPQLALRRLARSKKITFEPSSLSEVTVKVKKLNPEVDNIEQMQVKPHKPNEINQLQAHIQDYLTQIKPLLPNLLPTSQKYHPKKIPKSQPQPIPPCLPLPPQPPQPQPLQSFLQPPPTKPIYHQKQLSQINKNISSLAGIQNFPNLQCIALQNNVINSIEGIGTCGRLVVVDLAANRIKRIQGLRDLAWMRVLNLERNFIERVELRGGSLEVLYAGHNRIQDIVDLSNNVYMRRLFINNNNLHQLNGLSKLHFLQQLDANHNFLQSLSTLQPCLSLRILNASNNRLTQLHPKFTYIFLNKLILSHNFLEELPDLFLPSLEELYLNNNRIGKEAGEGVGGGREMGAVVYLPRLRVLDVDENRIGGFGVVWGLVRYGGNLRVLRYEQNEYFRDIRQKVRQLYQHIIYQNLPKLQTLNHNPYDVGIKKYYESIFQSYLSNKSITKQQSPVLQQVNKKISFIVKQNLAISGMEDRGIRFVDEEVFVGRRVGRVVEDFGEVLAVLSQKDKDKDKDKGGIEIKKEGKGIGKDIGKGIMHVSRSVFYQHDKFEYKLRNSLHKIQNLLVTKHHRLKTRKKYLLQQKPALLPLLQSIQHHLLHQKLLHCLKMFHLPLQQMSLQSAAVIIQKNWKCYRMRKKYKRIIKNLRKNKIEEDEEEEELEEIDLEQFDFDKLDLPQFNYQMPEDVDFGQFVIRPEIFDMINQQQVKRDQKMVNNNSGMHNNRNNQNAGNNGPMVDNFLANNQSRVTDHKSAKQQKIETLMVRWGVNRETAQIMYLKDQAKQRRKQKEAEKNMTAAQRYERFKRNHH